MKKWLLFLFALIVGVVWLAGCSSGTEPQQRPQDRAEQTESKEMTFTLYYGDREVMGLITEERTVTVPADQHPVQAALQELGKEPADTEAVVILPPDAEVLNVSEDGGLLIIDFNKNLRDNFYGGSSSEALLIQSIVNTVTDIEGYNGFRVQLLIEGEKVETIGGHIGAEEPFERQN